MISALSLADVRESPYSKNYFAIHFTPKSAEKQGTTKGTKYTKQGGYRQNVVHYFSFRVFRAFRGSLR